MAHSTFSRTSLGMAVAIAVGITAAPAVTSAGPLAAVTPVAQAQNRADRQLGDDIVTNVNVKSKAYEVGAKDYVTIGENGRDTRDGKSFYEIEITLKVPPLKEPGSYDLTLKNLDVAVADLNALPASLVHASRAGNTYHFEFSPTDTTRTYDIALSAAGPVTNGQDVTAGLIGNKPVHTWTVNTKSTDGATAPTTSTKPSTTTKPTPTTKSSTPTSTPKSEPTTKESKPSKPSSEPKPSATAQPAPSGDITDITVDDNGNYVITVAGGKKYEMKIGALRASVDNLNELVKQQRVDIAELEKKDQEVLKQAEKKIAATEKKLDALKQSVDAGKADKEAQRRAIADISTSIVGINNELNTVHTAIKQLTDSDIKEVRDNGDGSFTLIRNNGKEVHGNITADTEKAVETITTDDKGNLVVTNGAGKSTTVELNRTTVTESKDGDKDLVTITTASGDVTFEVGNTYISDVVKTDNGNYDIYRNDVEGVWKTIDLTDLRQEITQAQDRVEALKKQHAKDTEEQKKQREKDVTALNTRIDATNTKLTAAEASITALKGRATKVEKRVTDIEGSIKVINKDIATINKAIDVLDKRVTNLERHDEDWAKCYSGIGQAAIPMAFAIPLSFLAGLDLPGFDQANANLQHQIGAFNPAAAQWLDENRAGVRAAAGVLGIASVIGIIAHAATTCQDYNASDAAKDTDLAQTSSKITERFGRNDKADADK